VLGILALDAMSVLLLTVSLFLWLIAVLLSNAALFSVAVVSSIVSLTAVRGVPRWPLLCFWLWVGGILLYLLAEPTSEGLDVTLVAGVPISTFWMLLGVWLVPILLWPVAFAVNFRKWMKQ